MPCPECDMMLTRLAVLVHAYRRFAQRQHETLEHRTVFSWETCQEDPCREMRQLFQQSKPSTAAEPQWKFRSR